MYRPRVSVIIPLYNTELYIEETLNSALSQTLSNIEVIVINDGSTDNSLLLVQQLAASDRRIRVFSQSNKGLSITRNVGINYAQGEFIYFLDSDDLLECSAFELLYQECVRKELDFIFFDADSFVDAGSNLEEINYRREVNLDKEICKGPDVLLKLLRDNTYRAPVWMNFIRTSFLKSINLTFYPGILHEDELFTVKLFLNAERVGYLPEILIHRRMRLNSIMTKDISWRNIHGYSTVAKELVKYRKQINRFKREIVNLFLARTLNAIVQKAHVMSIKEKIRIVKEFVGIKCIRYIALYSWIVMFFKRG